MASAQRTKDLKTYCKQWKESLENIAARRDQLLAWQNDGLVFFEENNENILPTMISEADAVVLRLKKEIGRASCRERV